MIPGRKIFTPAGIMRKIRKRDENLQYLGKPLWNGGKHAEKKKLN